MSTSKVKPIAFYLPQFYQNSENDLWWGNGFTEWRSASTATPLFKGHYQPQLPEELGFHDQNQIETLKKQIDLAKTHSVYGFCHYYYWFNGQRLLNKPTELLLNSPELDMPFCLCWANENWTRTWSGDEDNILMEQVYNQESYIKFAESLRPYFSDPRYICSDKGPVFLLYRPDEIIDLNDLCDAIRTVARSCGHSDAYILGAETFREYGDWQDPRANGMDGGVEFPPHGMLNKTYNLRATNNAEFNGYVFDANHCLFGSLTRPKPDFPLHRAVFPAWDNTARRDLSANIYMGTSPQWFGEWLSAMHDWTARVHDNDKQFLFINSWNEWGEGAQIEPDLVYGRARLKTIKSVWDGTFPSILNYDPEKFLSERTPETINSDIAMLQVKIETAFPQSTMIETAVKAMENVKPIYNVDRWNYPFSLQIGPKFEFFSSLMKVRRLVDLRRVIGTALRVETPTKKSDLIRNKLFNFIHRARRKYK